MQARDAEVLFWKSFDAADERVRVLEASLGQSNEIYNQVESLVEKINSEALDKGFLASFLVSENQLVEHLEQLIEESLKDGVITTTEASDIVSASKRVCDAIKNCSKAEFFLRTVLNGYKKSLKGIPVAEEVKAHFESTLSDKGLKNLLVEQRRALKTLSNVANGFEMLWEILKDRHCKTLRTFLTSDAVFSGSLASKGDSATFLDFKDLMESCSNLIDLLLGVVSRPDVEKERVFDRLNTSLKNQVPDSLHSAIKSATERLSESIEVENQDMNARNDAEKNARLRKQKFEKKAHAVCVTARAAMYIVMFGGYALGAYLAYDLLFWSGFWATIFAVLFWGGSAVLLLLVWVYFENDGENPSDRGYSKLTSFFQSSFFAFLALIYLQIWNAFAFS